MNFISTFLAILSRVTRRNSAVLFDGYCPQCGGRQLRRETHTGRISCPQCG